MGINITDPLTSDNARVTSDNHLQVSARTVTEEYAAAVLGKAWNMNSGTINLTDANENGIMYLKNTGTNDLVIPSVIWLLGTTNGTFGEFTVKVIRNPTAGTVISDAGALTTHNRNFGANDVLPATVYVASASGKTITDGDDAVQSIFASSGRYVVAVALVIPPNATIGFSVQCPGSNTDCDVQVACPVYEKTLQN